jgi:hypothetical protein
MNTPIDDEECMSDVVYCARVVLSSHPFVVEVLISINLFVHIFLYSYYGLYELRVDIWWKKYLTSVQIVQFMIALIASLGAMVTRGLWTVTPRAWNLGGECHGSWSGSYFGLAIIVSYLYLFMQLYNEKYHSDQAAAAAKASKLQRDSAAKPAESPEFGSTFSLHAKTAPPSSAHAAVASALAVPALASSEDLFASMRDEWMSHPLHVADRKRWAEHQQAKKDAAGKKAAGREEGTMAEEVDDAPVKPAAILQKRFGTNSARL